MSKLSKEALRKRYNELNAILALDLTNWDPRTKPGLEGRKNSAKIEIETIKLQLATEILRSSRISIVPRDFAGTDQLVTAAKSDLNKNILLDFLSLEKGMYREIFGTKEGKNTFNSEIVNRLNMLLISVGEKIGAERLDALTAKSTEYATLASRQEMIEKIETTLTNTFDYQLKTLFLQSIIQDQVLERLNQGNLNLVLVNVPNNYLGIAAGLAGSSVVLSNESPVVTIHYGQEADPVAALIRPTKKRAKKVEAVETSDTQEQKVDEQ